MSIEPWTWWNSCCKDSYSGLFLKVITFRPFFMVETTSIDKNLAGGLGQFWLGWTNKNFLEDQVFCYSFNLDCIFFILCFYLLDAPSIWASIWSFKVFLLSLLSSSSRPRAPYWLAELAKSCFISLLYEKNFLSIWIIDGTLDMTKPLCSSTLC